MAGLDEVILLEEGLKILRTQGTQKYQKIAAADFNESFAGKEFMGLST